MPSGNEAANAALDALLDEWVADPSLTTPRRVDGLVREHASVFGYPVGIACRLGRGRDPRVAQPAAALCDWQWPDGGWNCDDEAKGHRSSFHESLLPTWGLAEYHRVTSEPRSADAVTTATELFFGSRLYRRSTGAVIDPSFTDLHWPAYWHYDILQALQVLGGIDDALADDRADDAFDLLEAKRQPDGKWRADGRWWRAPGSDPDERGPGGDAGAVEVVDWGTCADEMITFNALQARRIRTDRSRSAR